MSVWAEYWTSYRFKTMRDEFGKKTARMEIQKAFITAFGITKVTKYIDKAFLRNPCLLFEYLDGAYLAKQGHEDRQDDATTILVCRTDTDQEFMVRKCQTFRKQKALILKQFGLKQDTHVELTSVDGDFKLPLENDDDLADLQASDFILLEVEDVSPPPAKPNTRLDKTNQSVERSRSREEVVARAREEV